MALIRKDMAVHGVNGNAPYIISIAATAGPMVPRTFNGTGAPSSTTLEAGNGMYNAATSGFIVNASLVNAGNGYAVGNALSISGGTGTPLGIMVDMVNDNGAIIDFHVSQVGNYSIYPDLSAAETDGPGAGATFNLNAPAPDYYLDVTTPSEPVLYVCTTGGSNSSSVWAQISSGLNWQKPHKELDPTVAVAAGTFVYISPANPLVTTGLTDLVLNTPMTAMPGIWMALKNVPAQTTVSGTVEYNMPQPLTAGATSGSPLQGDADNAAAFWIPWADIMNCS
jgi:hypothetical protein